MVGEEGYVLCLWEAGFEDHGNGEDDEGEVGDDIKNSGREQVGVTLSALWPWVWYNLPVMREGLTGR